MHDARHRPAVPRNAVSQSGVAVAWLVVLAAAVLSLRGAGVPLSQTLAYLVAWLIGCTFPGVMVWRAVVGHSTIVRELGFGSVLGIVLQLVVWAAATAVHQPRLMLVLPAGVLSAFTLVPALRRHWRPARTAMQQTPVRWHLAMALVVALATFRLYRTAMIYRALPPEPSIINRDTWFNSAISHELSRTLRPQDPFVAGERLRYHWFADAHVTATAQLSGVPITTAMITLWLIPMLVVLLLVVAATAQHFLDGPRLRWGGVPLSDARRWWAGPVAGFFTLAAPSLWRLGNPSAQRVGEGFAPTSPSSVLALVLVVAVAGPVLDLLRRRSTRGTWVVLALLLATAAGTKPSILPVVAFGALVVVVLDLVRLRRVNWPMVWVVAGSALIAAAAAPFLTGSTGGSRLQLFALVTSDPSYAELLDRPVRPAVGGWLVPALAEQRPHAVSVIAMLLLVWLLTETPRLLALAGWAVRPVRTDPGVTWAAGVAGGGYAAMWVLAHPGYSQHYFWTVSLPLSTLLAVTTAVRLIPASRRAGSLLLPLVLVAVPGVFTAYLTTKGARVDLQGPTRVVIEERLRPFAIVLCGLVLAVAVTLVVRARVKRWSLPILTAVTAFALAAAVPGTIQHLERTRTPALQNLKVGVSYPFVSGEQTRAALWLQEHSAPTSVVVTNALCWPMGSKSPTCAKNGMWISGLTGRRTVLSDWTYSSATMAAYDGSVALNRTPSPWPKRHRLSMQSVQSPTPQVLQELRSRYDARWIFADDRASKISPVLDSLATLRYESDHIKIYRLRDSYAPSAG